MQPESWRVVKVPKLSYLNNCYIKIITPKIDRGVWISSNLYKLLLARVTINSHKPGDYEVNLLDMYIDPMMREESNNYCSEQCNLINVITSDRTKESVSYWMPLFPSKDNLKNVIESIYESHDDSELEIRVAFKVLSEFEDIWFSNQDNDVLIIKTPILVRFEAIGVPEDVSLTLKIYIG